MSSALSLDAALIRLQSLRELLKIMDHPTVGPPRAAHVVGCDAWDWNSTRKCSCGADERNEKITELIGGMRRS